MFGRKRKKITALEASFAESQSRISKLDDDLAKALTKLEHLQGSSRVMFQFERDVARDERDAALAEVERLKHGDPEAITKRNEELLALGFRPGRPSWYKEPSA